jgi:hypothetical protein
MFGPEREDVTGEMRKMRSLMICTPHPVLFWLSNREE